MALAHAVTITLFILAFFYKWFAVDDRYAVFLYNHLNATPFDEVTSSRYWMSGLVVSGVVMVLYIAANWLLGRIVANYRAPAWQRVWLWCALPVAIGIAIITTTANSPTLPPALAVACAVATLVGLALALMPGVFAAQQPYELIWLALDGAGLVPTLLLLRAIELPGKGLGVSTSLAYFVAIGSVVGGVVWLGVMSILRVWRRKPSPRAVEIFVAGLCWSYLLMPLAHHLFATPAAYRYITASANFFASNLWLQALSFLIAAGLAVGTTKLRNSHLTIQLSN